MIATTRRRFALVGLAALLSVSMSACGGATSQSAGDSSAAAGAKTPLKIGSDVSFAPWETYDSGKNVVGIDADIAAAISKELDRPIEWVNVGFSSLIPSLEAGRFDFIMSAMADKAAKREKVTFVDYAYANPSLLVPKGNPKNLHSLNDLCGLNAAEAAGSANEVTIQNASKACQAAGKPAITLLSVKLSSDIAQTMQTGRADFWLDDVVTHQTAVEAMGDGFEVVKADPKEINGLTWGIAFKKKDTELQKQVQEALQKVMDNGELKKIEEKYKLPAGVLLSEATIDQGKG